MTPLLQAVQEGWREHATLFIRNGAHVNIAPGPDGVTPLHAACASAMRGIVALMLRGCPNADVRDAHGRTPLHYAVAQRNPGDGRVQACLEAGADPTLHDDDGRNALHLLKAPEFVAWLVQLGCEPMLEDSHGNLPLHLALAEEDAVGMVQELLAAGAHPDALDGSGQTALHICACKGWAGAAVELLAAGALPDAEDATGQPVIFLAAAHGHTEVVQALLVARADVDGADEQGVTPLMAALRAGHEACARALVDNGADVEAADVKGMTVARYATKAGLQSVLLRAPSRVGKRSLMASSKLVANASGMWTMSRGPQHWSTLGASSSALHSPVHDVASAASPRLPVASAVADPAQATASPAAGTPATHKLRTSSGWLLDVQPGAVLPAEAGAAAGSTGQSELRGAEAASAPLRAAPADSSGPPGDGPGHSAAQEPQWKMSGLRSESLDTDSSSLTD